MAQALRIAVACAGDPADPAAFSGSPNSIMRALERLGHEAVPVAAEAPHRVHVPLKRALQLASLRPADLGAPRAALERAHWTVTASRPMARARSLAAARVIAREGPVHGAVQYGAEFALPRSVPVATWEDTTLRSALGAWEWPWLRGLSGAHLDDWARYIDERYRSVMACTFSSHWAAESAVRDHGAPPERVHVVGVGHTQSPPHPADRDWSVPRFLFVGHDWERKNGPRLLRAFATLRERHPDATLDLVGGHPPVDQPGVRGHGSLSLADPRARGQVEILYARSTCFVLPSLHEPSAVSHIEAAAAGLASIGSAAGGVATLIGDAGILVDPLDEAALVAALQTLADPATAARLGARAAERVPLFTWDAVARRLLRALRLGHEDVAFL